MLKMRPVVNPSGRRTRGAPVGQVLWYRLPEAPPPALLAPCASALSNSFSCASGPSRTSVLPRRPTCVFRLNLSRWVPWLQTASFCPLYSPTPRSPPTGSRRKSSSGTGAPLRMRWPESGASSSRSRWDWRRSPHFRVRMDQPHTTPCQVNINKSLNSPSDRLTPALCSASWQYIRVKCAQRAGEFRLREGVLKVKPQSTTGTGSGVIVWLLSL